MATCTPFPQKRADGFWLLVFLIVFALALAGCASNPNVSPAQNLVNTTGTSCKSLGDAIRATDAAVLNRVISKSAAQEAVKGFAAAQVACTGALGAIQAANPAASGVSP